MAFLAQINLAEAHAVCADVRLPKTGLLSFFLGCGADTYVPDGQTSERYLVDLMLGTAASDRGGWQVIYSADATHLQRRTWQVVPLPELFAPCAVSFKPGGNRLPGTGSVAYTLLPFTAEQRDDYNDILAQTQSEPTSERHLLLGQPDLIQSTPPEWMCELASRGDDPWLAIDPADPRYVEPATAAARWGLLLQLYSDDAANYLWGDGGHFYFYGPREAMAAGDFSGVWVNFEN